MYGYNFFFLGKLSQNSAKCTLEGMWLPHRNSPIAIGSICLPENLELRTGQGVQNRLDPFHRVIGLDRHIVDQREGVHHSEISIFFDRELCLCAPGRIDPIDDTGA